MTRAIVVRTLEGPLHVHISCPHCAWRGTIGWLPPDQVQQTATSLETLLDAHSAEAHPHEYSAAVRALIHGGGR